MRAIEQKLKDERDYSESIIGTIRGLILVLNKDLRVISANRSFYDTFKVKEKDTKGKLIYKLGNGQWNIPALKKLLEDILPQNTFFKGFEVTHNFPFIGQKVMVLNARQIHFTKEGDASSEAFPPIVLLAIEDITEMMVVAETLVGHTKQLEAKLTEKTQKLENYIKKLEKEVNGLKNSSKKT